MPTQTDHSAALSYARALIELATQQKLHEQIGQELADLSKIVESDPAFSLFLKDPGISAAERGNIINKTIRPQVHPLLANFLGVLNEHGRLGMIVEAAAAYRELLDKLLGNIDVEVTVAQQLSDDQLDQVKQRVSQALSKNARVQQRVDEGIVGGLVLKVEDKLIDASVRSQLSAIRQQMLEKRPR